MVANERTKNNSETLITNNTRNEEQKLSNDFSPHMLIQGLIEKPMGKRVGKNATQ